MRAIDLIMQQYPEYSKEELIGAKCPGNFIASLFEKCEYEHCDDCWDQKINE